MGVYASHADIFHPTQAWDLEERCTACGNTGWVAYPINVGVDQNEYDPCPNGCEQMDPNERKDYLVRREDIAIPDWSIDAYVRSFRPQHGPDPFFILANHRGELLLKEGGVDMTPGFGRIGRLHPTGDVTTDEPVSGFLDTDAHVYVTVPAYLVGTPIKKGEERWSPLVVRYEYLGAYIDIVFYLEQQGLFRFSYEFETSFSTAEMLR